MISRETINDKPVLGYALLVLVLTAAVLVFAASSGGSVRTPPELRFFSVDDGRTFFAAGRGNHPPFDHEGQTAVAAAVFECDGRRFVGYLERYTPAMKRAFDRHGDAPPGPGLLQNASRDGIEVKRPGEDAWVNVSQSDPYHQIVGVTCPGTSRRAEPVFP
ncbi:MAG: hypothetical protein AAF800_09550 [Planctomycetota bacterium]